MTQAATVLPMQRCPGCGRLLDGTARTMDFPVASQWWRALVGDAYPLCPDCHVQRDSSLLKRAAMTAVNWWVMDRELRLHRAADAVGRAAENPPRAGR